MKDADGHRELGGPLTATREAFREALSRLAAAVNVVTTAGHAGTHAATVSAVCSVTDDPPTVLICLNRTGQTNRAIRTNRRFWVNMLGADQRQAAVAFAAPGFTGLDQVRHTSPWSEPSVPILPGCLNSLECDVTDIRETGTHSVIFGRVRAISLGADNRPLIYFRRGYHGTTSATDERDCHD